ncbi:hypothetical protein Ancab_020987 [Ancistrocladus abbreviatus]
MYFHPGYNSFVVKCWALKDEVELANRTGLDHSFGGGNLHHCTGIILRKPFYQKNTSNCYTPTN